MHINNTYALQAPPTRPQYDDSIDYYIVRCPDCDFTSYRMTEWSARDVARIHDRDSGHSFFGSKIYRADSMAIIQSDRDSRRIFY